ncbi:MAG TPA: hypothetical protein VLA96_10725 [Terriglobales bacterium]|jgi:hypothetical protein|nr:hypothetical protein [Terriglobales bacterium]
MSEAEVAALITKLQKSALTMDKWNAAEALGKLGPAANSAVSALDSAMLDRDIMLAQRAAVALGQIVGQDAAAALLLRADHIRKTRGLAPLL